MKMLWTINPTAKMLVNLLLIISCMFVFDPVTPLMLMAIALLTGILGGAFKWKHLSKFVPFLLFAVGMVWMNAAWAKIPGAKVIYSLGFLNFTDKGLMLGISLGMRIMAIASFSLLFTFATDPTDFMLSLVQQCRLSPGIAYGVLAALRFFPTMDTELNTIKSAHRIRGKGKKGVKGSAERWYRYAIPLLAGAIRKAERTAIANA
jgi:energy-coupling factor transport system permease protein